MPAAQADSGLSLEAQRAKLQALATVNDLDLVDVVVDAGASAKSLDRPGWQRVSQMVNKQQVEHRRAGLSWGKVADKLNAAGHRTRTGRVSLIRCPLTSHHRSAGSARRYRNRQTATRETGATG